jgi:hypothetical protein
VGLGPHVLDRRARELRAARDALVADALDAEAGDTYAVLAASGRLAGLTAERARRAVAQMTALWRGLEPLDDVLAQVEERLADAHGDDHETAELMALMDGPSIMVASGTDEPGAEPVPRRSLTPDELLGALQGALDPVHQLVAEVDDAWRQLVPRLDRVSAEADRMAAELPGLRSLAAARVALDELPDRIVKDPLGAADQLTRIESTLVEATGSRAELARLGGAVTAAARILAEVEGLMSEGRDAFDRSRAEIVGPDGLLEPVDSEVLTREPGLGPWLTRLERLVAEGEAPRAWAGLEHWRTLADQTMTVARQVAEANARPWRRRGELQGLLRAARVKAGALGLAEDPAVTELAGRAAQALAVPCDLAAAESAVETFLDALHTPAPPGRAEPGSWTQPDRAADLPTEIVEPAGTGRAVWAPA